MCTGPLLFWASAGWSRCRLIEGVGRCLETASRTIDPVPMPLVRLMDVERAQLLVEADGRASLNRFLWQWQATFNAPSGIDWTIEVDPASI